MHKKVCRILNYIKISLILVSTITGCVLISVFALLVDSIRGIASSAVGLKICVTIVTLSREKEQSLIK